MSYIRTKLSEEDRDILDNIYDELVEKEKEDKPTRKETANRALRTLFQQEDIHTYEGWINFKGGATYTKVYKWIENYLGRKVQGTEKESVRHLVHEQAWYKSK